MVDDGLPITDDAGESQSVIRNLSSALFCALCVLCGPFGVVENAEAQTTLIKGATVIDGTGAPGRVTDVRIADGKITAIGNWDVRVDNVIDGRGLVLAPGFIDTHSHHDRDIFQIRGALGAVSQGITTIVVGQDGSSRYPLARFFSQRDSQHVALNGASYVGHGTLRLRVMGGGDAYKRPATPDEIERMRQLFRSEMQAGALGLSTGLEYDPGIFSTPDEVIELAKVAASFGGRYISHIRSEDRQFWQAIDEIVRIGREAKLPVQVSHMKLAMRALWGQGDSLVRVLDRARAEGINITADVYPYTMWQSTLTVLYPDRNFSDRAETEFILKEVATPDDLLIGQFTPNRAYEGKTVREIAEIRGSDPATTLMTLIAETNGPGKDESVVATGMDERDIATIVRWPFANICSDGELDGPHPRGFGSFPRVLGRYVREQKVVPLEEAIRKMTSLAAANIGVNDRGVIRPGLAADLVLFDPATIGDRSTTKEPHALSVGVRRVWVNGQVVFANGRTTGAFPGRVIRRGEQAAANGQ